MKDILTQLVYPNSFNITQFATPMYFLGKCTPKKISHCTKLRNHPPKQVKTHFPQAKHSKSKMRTFQKLNTQPNTLPTTLPTMTMTTMTPDNTADYDNDNND